MLSIVSCATCRFYLDETKGYSCELTDALVETENLDIDIEGSHLDEYLDSNVLHLTAIYSTIVHVPKSLFNRFTNLESLVLNDVALQTISETSFFNCSQLRFLSLERNFFNRIPVNTISKCVNLVELRLSNNFISTIDEFALSGLLHLERLDLERVYLKYVSVLSEQPLTSMRYLNLKNGFMTHLVSDMLKPMPNLKTLDLTQNFLVTIPEDFFQYSSDLEELHLSFNNLTSLDRTVFKPLVNLKVLDLERCNLIEVHHEAFRTLASLERLTLQSNFISQPHPDLLKFATKLKHFDISWNEMLSVDSIGSDFFANNTALEVLRLSGLRVFVLRNEWLVPLKNLKVFHYDFNGISNEDSSFTSAAFQSNTKLEELSLRNNFIDTIESSFFAENTQLQRLSLDANRISKIERNIFETLPRLKVLELWGNLCISEEFVDWDLTSPAVLERFQKCFDNFEGITTTPAVESTTQGASTIFDLAILQLMSIACWLLL